MEHNIENILSFDLSGKFAHFRKYYTNTSALTYFLPPKTVLMGMISSVLEIPRNEYYDLFDCCGKDCIYISVKISEKSNLVKRMHSINNLSDDYYKLANFNEKGKLVHSPTKTEIIVNRDYSIIVYTVFVGFKSGNQNMNRFISKIKNNDFGYGVYLGQRQFIGHIDNLAVYEKGKIEFLKESNILSTVCNQDNFINCDFTDSSINVTQERMPIGFEKIYIDKTKLPYRSPLAPKNIYFEKTGNDLHGDFRNCFKISNDNKDEYVSFF